MQFKEENGYYSFGFSVFESPHALFLLKEVGKKSKKVDEWAKAFMETPDVMDLVKKFVAANPDINVTLPESLVSDGVRKLQ